MSCVSEKVERFQKQSPSYWKHDVQTALLLTVVVAHELVSGGFDPTPFPSALCPLTSVSPLSPHLGAATRPQVHALPREADASQHVAVRALVYLPFNRPRVHPLVPSAKDKACP